MDETIASFSCCGCTAPDDVHRSLLHRRGVNLPDQTFVGRERMAARGERR